VVLASLALVRVRVAASSRARVNVLPVVVDAPLVAVVAPVAESATNQPSELVWFRQLAA
jgi:hypothetical protein